MTYGGTPAGRQPIRRDAATHCDKLPLCHSAGEQASPLHASDRAFYVHFSALHCPWGPDRRRRCRCHCDPIQSQRKSYSRAQFRIPLIESTSGRFQIAASAGWWLCTPGGFIAAASPSVCRRGFLRPTRVSCGPPPSRIRARSRLRTFVIAQRKLAAPPAGLRFNFRRHDRRQRRWCSANWSAGARYRGERRWSPAGNQLVHCCWGI